MDINHILSRLASPNFNILASLGKVNGVATISKFGENPDVSTNSTPETIWSYGGVYVFSTTAAIDTISSSNAGDSQEVTITGQTADNIEVTQTAILNGQSKVVLTTPLFRIYRAFNSNSSDLLGDVYIYEDDTIVLGVPQTANKVRLMIPIGSNQSEMMVYTVPAGKTLVYTEGFIAISRSIAGAADFILKSRAKDGVFRVQRRISLNSQGTGTWRAVYSVARVVSEKSDIVFECVNASANNMGLSGGFEGFLFDNVTYGL